MWIGVVFWESLEASFELRAFNLWIATKPLHIQEVLKPLKFECTCVFHFISYILMCSNDLFSPWSNDVCLLRFCIMTMCVRNVHYVHIALCTLWVIIVAPIECRLFWFHFILTNTNDFGFCFMHVFKFGCKWFWVFSY